MALTPNRGRGIFAVENLGVGLKLTNAPVLLFPKPYEDFYKNTPVLEDHLFYWDSYHDCLLLSPLQLLNHSYSPNLFYRRNYSDFTIEFTPRVPILKGEELTINYNGDPDSKDLLWFPVL